jgi:CRP-like cAMP-binding protein
LYHELLVSSVERALVGSHRRRGGLMSDVVVTGSVASAGIAVISLLGEGYSVAAAPTVDLIGAVLARERPALVVAAINGDGVDGVAAAIRPLNVPWLIWDLTPTGRGVAIAHERGALMYLTAAAGPDAIMQAVRRLVPLTPANPEHRPRLPRVRRRTVRRGRSVTVHHDQAVTIGGGVVAQYAVHSDGSMVLLGLFGPGQLLFEHPSDDCPLQFVAHTDVEVEMLTWEDATARPGFVERLRERLWMMEAWAAMQAHPHLDHRLLGILSLLAEQWGVPDGDGMRVELRITHAQLAAAVGATRATVTRTLSDLRLRGLIETSGVGVTERIHLRTTVGASHVASDARSGRGGP